MIKPRSLRLSILAGVVAVGAGSTAAHAATCSGTLAPGSYDSVNVLPGNTCIVSGAVDVTGNVTVGTGATLRVTSTARFTVNSSLLAVHASSVEIVPGPMGAANILGSVSVSVTPSVLPCTSLAVVCAPTTGSVDIAGAFVGGTLSVSNSSALEITLRENNVAGNVLFRNNTAPVDTNTIAGNTIGGSLVCTGNSPLPVDDDMPNTVGGAKVGQCSGL